MPPEASPKAPAVLLQVLGKKGQTPWTPAVSLHCFYFLCFFSLYRLRLHIARTSCRPGSCRGARVRSRCPGYACSEDTGPRAPPPDELFRRDASAEGQAAWYIPLFSVASRVVELMVMSSTLALAPLCFIRSVSPCSLALPMFTTKLVRIRASVSFFPCSS